MKPLIPNQHQLVSDPNKEENQQSIVLPISNPMVDGFGTTERSRIDALPHPISTRDHPKMQFKMPSKRESGQEAIHLDSN